MGIIDIILVVLFAVTVITSAARGFVRSIAGIIAWVLAGALAIGFCSTVAEKVYDTFLSQAVITAIEERTVIPENSAEIVNITSDVLDELPDFLISAAESVGADVESIKNEATFLIDEKDIAVSIEENVVSPIIQAALKAICFILMFFILSGLISFLLRPISKITKKLPLIKRVNTLLGGAMGVLKAAVIVVVLSMILEMAASFTDSELSVLVAQSQIVNLVIESSFSSSLFI